MQIVTNPCRHDNQSLSFPQLASDHHNFQGSTRIGVDRTSRLPGLRIHGLEAGGYKSSILESFSCCLVQLCHQVSFTFQLSLLPAKTQSERHMDSHDMSKLFLLLVLWASSFGVVIKVYKSAKGEMESFDVPWSCMMTWVLRILVGMTLLKRHTG